MVSLSFSVYPDHAATNGSSKIMKRLVNINTYSSCKFGFFLYLVAVITVGKATRLFFILTVHWHLLRVYLFIFHHWFKAETDGHWNHQIKADNLCYKSISNITLFQSVCAFGNGDIYYSLAFSPGANLKKGSNRFSLQVFHDDVFHYISRTLR